MFVGVLFMSLNLYCLHVLNLRAGNYTPEVGGVFRFGLK